MTDKLGRLAVEAGRGGTYLFFGTLAFSIIAGLNSIFVARFLGPEVYALYILVLVTPNLLNRIMDVGLGAGVNHFVAKSIGQKNLVNLGKFVISGSWLSLSMAVLAATVIFVFAKYFAIHLINRPELFMFIQLISIHSFFYILFNVMSFILLGLSKNKEVAVLLFVVSIVRAVMMPALVLLGFGIFGALAGYVVGTAVAFILAIAFVARNLRSMGGISTLRPSFPHLSRLLKFSLPLSIWGILMAFDEQLKWIIISLLRPDSEIGNFAAMITITLIAVFAIDAISTPLITSFSKMDLRSNDTKKAFSSAVRYSSLIAIPMSIALIVLSDQVMTVLYGTKFDVAPEYLRAYAVLWLFIAIPQFILPKFLIGIGDTRINIGLATIKLAFFIPLGFLLTYLLGVLGLILAILISTLILAFFGVLWIRRKFGIKPDFFHYMRVIGVGLLKKMPS